MNSKKIIAGIMAFCLMGGVMPDIAGFADNNIITAGAVDETEYTEGTYESLTYRNYGNHIEISGFDKSVAEVDIPSEIEGLPVTSIGESAFFSCLDLTSVNIPDSVTNIGQWAFSYCSLESISFPDSVINIDGAALAKCIHLTSVTILNPDCEIYDYAGTISNLYYDSQDPYFNGTIYGYDNSTAQAYAEKYGYKFESLGEAPINEMGYTGGTYESLTYKNYGNHIEIEFCNGTETEVVIPSEIEGVPVTAIEELAFRSCSSLTSVSIPDSVTSIGEYAFYDCSGLTSVNIPDGVVTIEEGVFRDCSGLTSVNIPDSVTSIGKFAFSNCSGLTSVNISDSVTTIGEQAFSDCSGLTSINIPDSVTTIGMEAFYGCSGLTSVNIPDSVTSIGDWAFVFCSGLTSINVSENNENYSDSDGILFDKNKTKLIKYPSSKTGTEYTVPDSVTTIENGAFHYCSDLVSINIPDSVVNIGDSAFLFCSGLTSINVSENNENYSGLNGIMFNKDKTELIKYPSAKTDTEYTVPDSITSIRGYAFLECSGMTSINIPESVESIGICAFYNCSGLTSINIPDSVTSIDEWAFEGCSGLTSINIPASITSIGNGTFEGCSGLTSVDVPDSVTSIELGAFSDCISLTSISILNPECEIYDYSGTISNGYDENNDPYFNGTIYGYGNSPAQVYAEKYGYKFELLGEAPAKESALGDIDGNGIIDASDASFVLAEYALLSTGDSGTFTESMKKSADINKDGQINSVDSSLILSYYAYTSTGGTDKIEKFLETSDI